MTRLVVLAVLLVASWALDGECDDGTQDMMLLQVELGVASSSHGQEKEKKGCMKMKNMFDTNTSNMSKSASWLATHVDVHRKSVRKDTACDPCGASSTYSEVIDTSGDYAKRTVYSSGCPNHYNYVTGKQSCKNCIGVEGDTTWSYEMSTHEAGYEIPAYPVLLDEADAFDIEFTMGLIGIALNGVAYYGGAVDADGNLLDVDDEDAEWTSFDICSGHASGFGEYHYHFPPSCLLAKLPAFSDGHSPQIGWSLDGFPLYGPTGPTGVIMLTCGNTGADSTYCLDSCSGLEGELPGVDNFKYRYYVTGNVSDLTTLPSYPRPSAEAYPYIIKCYRGCTMTKLENGNGKCLRKASAGYTDAHMPEASAGFTDVLQFENDKHCSSLTSTTTTSTLMCMDWCATNTKPWDTKCNWAKCEGCSDCR